MFTGTINHLKGNENSSQNTDNTFCLFSQNQNNQSTSNNATKTPQKLSNSNSTNQNIQNILRAPNQNKSAMFQNNLSSNTSAFGGNNVESNSNPAGGLFGNNNNSSNSNDNTSGLFGGNNANSGNNVATNNSSVGMGNSSAANNQNKGIFGANASLNSNTFAGSIAANNNNTNYSALTFGANNNQSSVSINNNSNNFGGKNNTNNNFQGQSLLGNNTANTNQSNSSASLFGNNSATNSNNQTSNSIFSGTNNSTNNNNNSNSTSAYKNGLFGNTNTSSTNNSSLFGNNANSLFNNKASENHAATNSNANPSALPYVFANDSTSVNANSIFGNNSSSNPNPNIATNPSANSIFGNPSPNNNQNPNSTSTPNLFSNNATATNNNQNSSSSNTNMLGNKTQTSTNNLLGNNANNASNTNLEVSKLASNLSENAANSASNNPSASLFGGNQNATNSYTKAAQNPKTSGGLFNSSAQNGALNKPNETNSLFTNNANTMNNNSNTKKTEITSLFGNSTNASNLSTNPSNNQNSSSNPTASLFSSNNISASLKPANSSLFSNPTLAANSASEAPKKESAQAETKSLFGNAAAKTNLTSPFKTNQAINSNLLNNSYTSINNPEKAGESKAKLNQLTTIYPYAHYSTENEKLSNKPVAFENNLESKKNILGISRNDISERVIDAISKKMTIKEFFTKASEEALHENKLSSLKPKSKKSENQYEIFDETFSRKKDSYLETKYQMYLQREIFKQKQKIESKRKMNFVKNAFDFSQENGDFAFGSLGKRTSEKEFCKSFKKMNYMSLLEKNFEMNKNDSPFNYNLAETNNFNFSYRNAENKRNFNQKNFELIKIFNEDNFGYVNNPLEMQSKLKAYAAPDAIEIDNVYENNNLYLGKTDSKVFLAGKAQEKIDLYDPSFWQSKVMKKKEAQAAEKKGLTSHLNNIKDGINNFFSIFSQEEAEEEKFVEKKDSANLNKKIISIIAEIKDKSIFLSFHAHKDSTVAVLKGYIIEKFKERSENKFFNLKNEHLLILFKSSILVDDNTLGKYEFDPAAENKIQVIISSEKESLKNSTNLNPTSTNYDNQAEYAYVSANKNKEQKNNQFLNKIGEKSLLHLKSVRLRKKSKSPGKENINRNSNNLFNNQMLIDSEEKKEKEASDDFFPIFNNEFELNPSIQFIYRMKKSELRSVEGFKISNGFGKIKFKTKVDLTYLNLSEVVRIDRFEVELYPGKEIPRPGEGLNKPAVITIKQMFGQADNIKTLIQGVKEKGGRFIGYDEIKGKFKFEVDRWIK